MSARKLVTGRSWHRQRCRLGNPRTETRVGAAVIVMRHPRAQNLSQMALVERNQMVETFATHGADHPLTERVRLWYTGRRLHRPEDSWTARPGQPPVKMASRSCTTNRYGSSPVTQLLNCCVVHSAVGCSVVFQCRIRPVPISSIKNTK